MQPPYSDEILARSAAGESPLYIAVKTTGIFCRPGCPAKPKPSNRLLLDDAPSALEAGYRPCKRCRPLSHPLFTSDSLQAIVAAIEASPEHAWDARSLAELSGSYAEADQEFHRRFGLSLTQYADMRRLALAAKAARKRQQRKAA